ncbi:Yip1 family protein [Solimonas terrae]|uniref:YIP1 family protein n=1 Tax=Solimonas terrae TaxID=1396819 RepID=A0A6M2BRX4_9GAMM|nr:Yip1 family protein [Solimonas terrae]NGY05238.1 YIP1 family protein [Solimonas terrae]
MSQAHRLWQLLIAPRIAWQQIACEPQTTRELYARHVLPLAAIGPACSFIGMSLIGIDVPRLGHYRVPLPSGLAHALVSYGLTLFAVFVLAKLIDAFSAHFSARPDAMQAIKLSAYAATPAWLGGLFHLLPALSLLATAAGLYSLYLLYLGLPPLMQAPPGQAGRYAAAVIIAAIVLALVVGAVAGSLLQLPSDALHDLQV